MPTQIGFKKIGNLLAHISKKFHSEELQVHVDVGLLFLLVYLCPSLCLLFLCVGFLAYLSQQIQKRLKIIVGLSGAGDIPDPFNETRGLNTLIGQPCVPPFL